jgi:hypothetical protein
LYFLALNFENKFLFYFYWLGPLAKWLKATKRMFDLRNFEIKSGPGLILILNSKHWQVPIFPIPPSLCGPNIKSWLLFCVKMTSFPIGFFY